VVDNGLTNHYVKTFAVDATTSPATVYAGTWGRGVFASSDGGASWRAAN
jgi:hypothetical protein